MTANDNDIFGDLDTTAFHEDDMSWFDGPFDSNMMNIDLDAAFKDQGAENHFTPVFDDESTIGGPTPQPGPTPAASNTDALQEPGSGAAVRAYVQQRCRDMARQDPRPAPPDREVPRRCGDR